jgi:hypothetical protein
VIYVGSYRQQAAGLARMIECAARCAFGPGGDTIATTKRYLGTDFAESSKTRPDLPHGE